MKALENYTFAQKWFSFYEGNPVAWFDVQYSTVKLVSYRENKEVSINAKVPSPPASSGRPATSPKELSSPRRPASRKGLERSATQTEIIKKESQPRSAHLVSKNTVVKNLFC